MDTLIADEAQTRVATRKAEQQRSQLYVKRQFQKSMVLEVVLITFIMLNVLVTTVYWMMNSFSNTQHMTEYLAYTIAALEVIGFIAIYRYNLRASHRIAGPVFNLERCLSEIENGELGLSLRLREHDQFHEMADQFNITVEAVRAKVASAQQIAADMQAHGQQDPAQLQALIDELSYFQTMKLPTGTRRR